jgi:hypothetical protein
MVILDATVLEVFIAAIRCKKYPIDHYYIFYHQISFQQLFLQLVLVQV